MSTSSVQPNVVEFKRPVRPSSMMGDPDMHSMGDIPAAVVAEMEYQKSAELAKTNKKLVTVVMGMTLLLGLVACMAYLAGRSITSMKSQSAAVKNPLPIFVDSPKVKAEIDRVAAAVPPLEVSKPVVEAPRPVASVAPAPVVAAPAVTAPVVAPKVAAPKIAPPVAAFATPNKGELYLQVGHVETRQAAGLAAQVASKGFTTKTIAGDNPNSSRVVIGPISNNEMAAYQARLMDAGYESFPRRF